MIADTSVWIDHFADRSGARVAALQDAFTRGLLYVPDLVVYEVLRGFRGKQTIHAAQEAFEHLPVVRLGGRERSEIAAMRYRKLRRNGITIRRSIDVLIASYCIDEEIALLFDDRDFLPFVEYFGLRRVAY